LEYAYDDYATALLAKELGDTKNYEMLMKRTGNYTRMYLMPRKRVLCSGRFG
jgi:putative alpha-1,2-mannosidase